MFKRFWSKQASLTKIASLNVGAVSFKIITGLIVSKIAALWLGPSGIALIGNLRNGQKLVYSLAEGGFQKGIIKHIAEEKDSEHRVRLYIQNFISLSLLLGIIIGAIVVVFSNAISIHLFQNDSFRFVIVVLGLTIPFHALNVSLLSVAQGIGVYKKVVAITVWGSILNLLLFIFFTLIWSLKGALIAVTSLTTAQLFISLFYYKPYFYYLQGLSFFNYSKTLMASLPKYALMTLVPSLIFPFVLLELRNFIINNLSETDAGHWEAINRLSQNYIMVIMYIMNLYVLPKLASSPDKFILKYTIVEFYKKIIPFVVIGFLMIFLLKQYILQVVYSKEFLPAEELFLGQLIGDFFYILALVMVFHMHAKRQIFKFILTDVFKACCFYLLSIWLIEMIGIVGIAQSHAISNLLYFILVFFVSRKAIFPK